MAGNRPGLNGRNGGNSGNLPQQKRSVDVVQNSSKTGEDAKPLA